MNIQESFIISLTSLKANKVRAFLTMLGVIIGVMSIVLLISIVAGTQAKMEGEMKSMGSNVLMVIPGNSEEMHGPPGTFTVNKLNLKFVDMIEARSSYGAKASAVYQTMGQIVKYKRESRNTTMIAGVGANFTYVRNWNVATGSFFKEEDVKSKRKICVVGETIVNDLYKGLNPIGKEINIGDKKAIIIGITEPKGRFFGQDSDDIVALPITTMQEMFGTTTINQIIVKIPDPRNMEKGRDEIKRLLLREMEKEDFSISSQGELLEKFNMFTGILSVVMGCVAGISLFVGGIGIMNIMLVTVRERTREIGLRKAVGATSYNIMMQFMVEAVLIAVTGALAGIITAVLIIEAAAPLIPFPLKASMTSIIISFIFATVTGIFFGTYPAVKAAKTDPIIALRYE